MQTLIRLQPPDLIAQCVPLRKMMPQAIASGSFNLSLPELLRNHEYFLILLLIETLWGLNISLTGQAESNKGANFDFFTRKKVKPPIEIN